MKTAGRAWTRLSVSAVGLTLATLVATGASSCGKKPAGSAGPERKPAPKTTETTPPAEPTPKVSPGRVLVTLYYSDSNAERLVKEEREIPKTSAIAKAVIEELIKGPRETGLYPTVPRQLKLLGVKKKGSVLEVNLSNVRKSGLGGTAAEMMLAYSIVYSLTELPGVKAVDFLVDGKHQQVLVDAVEITEPLERNEKLFEQP